VGNVSVNNSITVKLPITINATIIDWELLAYEIVEDQNIENDELRQIADAMREAADIVEESIGGE
jgi:hypothetical protein